MRSVMEHPEVVECLAGRLLGPFDPSLFPEVHTNWFGVIPKSDPEVNTGSVSTRGSKCQ